MSVTANIQKQASIGGKTLNENKNINGNMGIIQEVQVPKAQGGAVTSGGGTTSAVFTMGNPSHGIITGTRADVYWATGALVGGVVGTVSGNSVPVSGGTYIGYLGGVAPTTLPANTTPIQVATPVNQPLNLVGNSIQVLSEQFAGITPNTEAIFAFYASTTLEYTVNILNSAAKIWYQGNGDANPLSGISIDHVYMSHNDILAAQTMRVGVVSN